MLRLTVFFFTLFFLVTISKVTTLPTPQPSLDLEKRQPNPEDSQPHIISYLDAHRMGAEVLNSAREGTNAQPDQTEQALDTVVEPPIAQDVPEPINSAQFVDTSNVVAPATLEEAYAILGLGTPPYNTMTQAEAYQNGVNGLPESSNWVQTVDVSHVVPPTA